MGCVGPQVPAGVLTQRLGGHRFLTWSLVTTSALSILLPPCAYIGGWRLVCANRMLQGVTQVRSEACAEACPSWPRPLSQAPLWQKTLSRKTPLAESRDPPV